MVETLEMKLQMSKVRNIDHKKLHIALLIALMLVVGTQSIVTLSEAATGPFRLAVVVDNWVEYVVAKSVNAEKICFTFAPGGPGGITSKPLREGDRIKIIVKRFATGQGTHYVNSTISYVTEGFALTDLYLNGQILWSADSSMNDYRPMGLDFHYVVGDGYWDTIRTKSNSVAVADRNVTISYSNYGEGAEWVRYNIKVDKNTGVVLESSRTSYTSSIGDTSAPPQGECLLRIVDTNIAGVTPLPWYIQYWYIIVLIPAGAVSALTVYLWKIRKPSASKRRPLDEGTDTKSQ